MHHVLKLVQHFIFRVNEVQYVGISWNNGGSVGMVLSNGKGPCDEEGLDERDEIKLYSVCICLWRSRCRRISISRHMSKHCNSFNMQRD